jgi:hypothetical protein
VVPQLDFTSLNFANFNTNFDLLSWLFYGPSAAVHQVAGATMALGQILPISPPIAKASWTLSFPGPSLQCNDYGSTSEADAIWVNLWNSMMLNTSVSDVSSWVPWSPGDYFRPDNATAVYSLELDLNSIDYSLSHPYLPYVLIASEATSATEYVPVVDPTTSLVSTDGPMSIWIASLPQMHINNFILLPADSNYIFNWAGGLANYRPIQSLNESFETSSVGQTDNFTPSLMFQNSTLIRCDLINSSYLVDFDYTSGEQRTNVSTSPLDDSQSINGSYAFLINATKGQVNSKEILPTDFSTFAYPWNYDATDVEGGIDPVALRLSSYQGIMAAFNLMLRGSRSGNSFELANMPILQTVLADTNELRSIRDWYFLSNTSSLGQNFTGLQSSGSLEVRGDLISTLEELFQNVTVSLLSEPSL